MVRAFFGVMGGSVAGLASRLAPLARQSASNAARCLPARSFGGALQQKLGVMSTSTNTLLGRQPTAGSAPAMPASVRGIFITPVSRSLNDFFISKPLLDKDGNPTFPAVGRAWKAEELREKSFEDLHKLWWICLKERNSLAYERAQARAKGLMMLNPRRWRKIRKTMARIKVVLGERKRMRDLLRSQGKILTAAQRAEQEAAQPILDDKEKQEA